MNVGRVRRIALDPRAADRVMVIVELASDTPVDETTVARLTPQGVTGLLFIDLQQAVASAIRNASPPVPSQRHPVIRSLPSNLDVFLNGLPDLLAQANRTLERLNQMLSEENVAAANAVLANVREASDALPALSRDAGRLVAELQATTAEARRVAEQANRLTLYRVLGGGWASTTGRIDALLERSGPGLERFGSQGLAEVEMLVRDSRVAINEVRDLARSLRESPSQLLYQPAPSGVEIPR